MEEGLNNANNPFGVANGTTADNIITQKNDGLLLNLSDKFKQNGTDLSPVDFFEKSNGKRSASEFEDDDFGPETDVDTVDDLLSPGVKDGIPKSFTDGFPSPNNNPLLEEGVFNPFMELQEKAALEMEKNMRKRETKDDFEDEERMTREETPTPPAGAVHDVSGLVENPADSESEDEWNYIKGEEADKENISPQPEKEVADIPEEDDTMSQLNPNAAEFVPVSPTRSIPSPACRTLINDPIVSQSPKKANEMDISVPNPREFENEVKSRPSEFDSCNNGHNEDDGVDCNLRCSVFQMMLSQKQFYHPMEGQKLKILSPIKDPNSSKDLMENILNGKNIDEIPEFQPGSTPKKVFQNEEFHFGPNAAPFTPKRLDQSEALSTRAVYGDESEATVDTSFNESINQDLNILNKESDPMSMSFYADKGESNPFDLNKVQELPDNLDEFLTQTNNDSFNETFSDLPEHRPLGTPNKSNILNNDDAIQITDLDKHTYDDEKELASPLEADKELLNTEETDFSKTPEPTHENLFEDFCRLPEKPKEFLINFAPQDSSEVNDLLGSGTENLPPDVELLPNIDLLPSAISKLTEDSPIEFSNLPPEPKPAFDTESPVSEKSASPDFYRPTPICKLPTELYEGLQDAVSPVCDNSEKPDQISIPQPITEQLQAEFLVCDRPESKSSVCDLSESKSPMPEEPMSAGSEDFTRPEFIQQAEDRFEELCQPLESPQEEVTSSVKDDVSEEHPVNDSFVAKSPSQNQIIEDSFTQEEVAAVSAAKIEEPNVLEEMPVDDQLIENVSTSDLTNEEPLLDINMPKPVICICPCPQQVPIPWKTKEEYDKYCQLNVRTETISAEFAEQAVVTPSEDSKADDFIIANNHSEDNKTTVQNLKSNNPICERNELEFCDCNKSETKCPNLKSAVVISPKNSDYNRKKYKTFFDEEITKTNSLKILEGSSFEENKSEIIAPFTDLVPRLFPANFKQETPLCQLGSDNSNIRNVCPISDPIICNPVQTATESTPQPVTDKYNLLNSKTPPSKSSIGKENKMQELIAFTLAELYEDLRNNRVSDISETYCTEKTKFLCDQLKYPLPEQEIKTEYKVKDKATNKKIPGEMMPLCEPFSIKIFYFNYTSAPTEPIGTPPELYDYEKCYKPIFDCDILFPTEEEAVLDTNKSSDGFDYQLPTFKEQKEDDKIELVFTDKSNIKILNSDVVCDHPKLDSKLEIVSEETKSESFNLTLTLEFISKLPTGDKIETIISKSQVVSPKTLTPISLESDKTETTNKNSELTVINNDKIPKPEVFCEPDVLESILYKAEPTIEPVLEKSTAEDKNPVIISELGQFTEDVKNVELVVCYNPADPPSSSVDNKIAQDKVNQEKVVHSSTIISTLGELYPELQNTDHVVSRPSLINVNYLDKSRPEVYEGLENYQPVCDYSFLLPTKDENVECYQPTFDYWHLLSSSENQDKQRYKPVYDYFVIPTKENSLNNIEIILSKPDITELYDDEDYYQSICDFYNPTFKKEDPKIEFGRSKHKTEILKTNLSKLYDDEDDTRPLSERIDVEENIIKSETLIPVFACIPSKVVDSENKNKVSNPPSVQKLSDDIYQPVCDYSYILSTTEKGNKTESINDNQTKSVTILIPESCMQTQLTETTEAISKSVTVGKNKIQFSDCDVVYEIDKVSNHLENIEISDNTTKNILLSIKDDQITIFQPKIAKDDKTNSTTSNPSSCSNLGNTDSFIYKNSNPITEQALEKPCNLSDTNVKLKIEHICTSSRWPEDQLKKIPDSFMVDQMTEIKQQDLIYTVAALSGCVNPDVIPMSLLIPDELKTELSNVLKTEKQFPKPIVSNENVANKQPPVSPTFSVISESFDEPRMNLMCTKSKVKSVDSAELYEGLLVVEVSQRMLDCETEYTDDDLPRVKSSTSPFICTPPELYQKELLVNQVENISLISNEAEPSKVELSENNKSSEGDNVAQSIPYQNPNKPPVHTDLTESVFLLPNEGDKIHSNPLPDGKDVPTTLPSDKPSLNPECNPNFQSNLEQPKNDSTIDDKDKKTVCVVFEPKASDIIPIEEIDRKDLDNLSSDAILNTQVLECDPVKKLRLIYVIDWILTEENIEAVKEALNESQQLESEMTAIGVSSTVAAGAAIAAVLAMPEEEKKLEKPQVASAKKTPLKPAATAKHLTATPRSAAKSPAKSSPKLTSLSAPKPSPRTALTKTGTKSTTAASPKLTATSTPKPIAASSPKPMAAGSPKPATDAAAPKPLPRAPLSKTSQVTKTQPAAKPTSKLTNGETRTTAKPLGAGRVISDPTSKFTTKPTHSATATSKLNQSKPLAKPPKATVPPRTTASPTARPAPATARSVPLSARPLSAPKRPTTLSKTNIGNAEKKAPVSATGISATKPPTKSATTVPPKPRTLTGAPPFKPKVPQTKTVSATKVLPDNEKQIKESANKITASRNLTQRTTKVSSTRTTVTKSTTSTTKTAALNKKKPVEIVKTNRVSKTETTKIEKPKENGISTVVTEEITVVNNAILDQQPDLIKNSQQGLVNIENEEPGLIKDNSPVDNKIIETQQLVHANAD